MARRVFPADRATWTPVQNGPVLAVKAGTPIAVYTDAGATVPADCQQLDTTPTTTSPLLVDTYSQMPLWLGPADGTDTLYVVIASGPVTPVYARTDDRLDDLDARVATLESGATDPGALRKAANLSDVVSVPTSRGNLGLGTAATRDTGTGATQVVLGNDARLSDQRTPSAHAASHATAGSDPVSPASIGALRAANNLSDLASAAGARTNLGLGEQALFRVDRYGATGNGATDDTAAIASAWAALVAGGGGRLHFPPGNYLTTGIVLQGGSNFRVSMDEGAALWTSRGTTGAPTQATHNVLTIADCTDFELDGVHVDGRRDVIAGDQYLTVNGVNGQNTITVQDGTAYSVGEMVQVFGGLTVNGGAEKDRNLPFVHITAINGNVLTLSANLNADFTATGTAGGAYVTRYQTGDSSAYSAAGRTLGNEDAQNGIHLISCHRFRVVNCSARNVWESPIKCGTGFQASTVTDGCSDGIIASNVCEHGYDQGISVWVSQRIAVVGNRCDDAGWAGISFTHADDCSATGNVCTNNSYRPPGDTDAGTGIAAEGSQRISISGNVCTGNHSNGIRLGRSPVFLGSTTLSAPAAGGASSITVGSASFMATGTSHTLIDAVDVTKRENIQVLSKSGNAVTLTAALRNSYASGSTVGPRYNADVAITANICSNSAVSAGINAQQAIGLRISGNDCSGNGLGVDLNGTYGIQVSNDAHGAAVTDNTCGGNAQEGILVDSCVGVAISDNAVSGSGLASTVKHGIKAYGLVDGQIVGNRSERNSGDGIHLEPGGGRNTSRLSISGNVGRNNGQRGLMVDSGDAWGLAITGNNFVGNGEPGMDLRGVRDSVITGNESANNHQEGIRFSDTSGHACTKNLVSYNLLYDDQGGSATQPWGLKENDNTANTQVVGNRLYGNTNSAQLSLSGTSTSSANIVN